MDEISKQRQTKLSDTLEAAGWKPNTEGISTNPTRFWIYSISLENGPRLTCAIGAEYLREMIANTGQVAQLQKDYPDYWMGMASAIAMFDTATRRGEQTEEVRQILSKFAGFYARNTQTWNIVQPLNKVDGTHFIILDWIGQDGGRIMRPAHIHRADPLSHEELLNFTRVLIDMHLAKRPEDKPLCFNE